VAATRTSTSPEPANRIGALLEPEYLRTAILVHNNCFHISSPLCVGPTNTNEKLAERN
jgi:hypothetical protein